MSDIDKCCLNCAYFRAGWCDLFGIVPYPPDKIDCANFAPKANKISCVTENKKIVKQTVFDKITESIGTLAEKLVYESTTCASDGRVLLGYRSTIIRGFWLNKEEAIATTIKELKKGV